MKTKFTLLIILAATAFSLNAQIPNPGFESWTAGEPNGWTTYNVAFAGTTTQSSDYHTGTSAARLNAVNIFGTTFGGYLFAGSASMTGFPISSAPLALHGWYKFQSTSSTESASIVSSIQYQGASSGVTGGTITANTSVYTEFIFNYYYSGAAMGDSAQLYMTMGSSDSLRTTTHFIVDDLAFGAPTAINEISKAVELEPCTPNPANQVANIIYRIPGHSIVNLAIYDLVGRQVKSLLDNTEQNAGRYKVPADVSALPEGIYLYRLNVNGQAYTQKLIVSR